MLPANKEDLVKDFKRAVYWEEEFLVQYRDENITELLKTLPEGKFKRIKELLDENLADSERHEKVTRYLLEKIENGE